ncbi:MAG: TIGR00266 family protein [Candidatus Njordarchaeia archaeon]
MEWNIDHSPAYSILKVKLKPGEKLVAEPGAMVLMKKDIKIETKMQGGFFRGLKRKFLGGESLFMNTYHSGPDGGEVWLAPSLPGDITYIKLEGQSISVQDMAYVAHHGDIDVDIAFRGFKGLLAEGEVFWLKLSGTGGVWLGAYGGVDVIELGPSEKTIIDNFHTIAIEDSVKWKIRKFGGWKSFILGGEGLVVEAKGPGKIYTQSRIIPELVKFLLKFIPKK